MLGDWFDYVGGTSTGAIIAGGVAIGLPVEPDPALYASNMRARSSPGPGCFDLAEVRGTTRTGIEEVLRREFGEDRTLGSADLRCLLLLGLRNTSTGSPWPVSSNPAGRYNQGPGSNLDLPLWQLVRASSAAPTFFVPEEIALGEHDVRVQRRRGDHAEQPGPPAGPDGHPAGVPARLADRPRRLLLVSVGTGTTEQVDPACAPGTSTCCTTPRPCPRR